MRYVLRYMTPRSGIGSGEAPLWICPRQFSISHILNSTSRIPEESRLVGSSDIGWSHWWIPDIVSRGSCSDTATLPMPTGRSVWEETGLSRTCHQKRTRVQNPVLSALHESHTIDITCRATYSLRISAISFVRRWMTSFCVGTTTTTPWLFS